MKGVFMIFSILSLVMADISIGGNKAKIHGNEVRFEGDKLFVNGKEVEAQKNDKGEYYLDFLGDSTTIRLGGKVLTGSSAGVKKGKEGKTVAGDNPPPPSDETPNTPAKSEKKKTPQAASASAHSMSLLGVFAVATIIAVFA